MKLVPPKKVLIFNYQTLSTALLLESKSLEVILKKDYLNLKTIEELTEIMSWCQLHTEVKSLFITGQSEIFCKGFDYEDIKSSGPTSIRAHFENLYQLNLQMINIPQTVVIDFKNGALNEGLILGLCADIRLSSDSAEFQFNELSNGLIDSSGLFTLMQSKLNQGILTSLVLSEMPFSKAELNLLGGFTLNNSNTNKVLENISKQSSVARVQTKCALQNTTSQNEVHHQFNKKLLNATLSSNDYLKENDFVNLREFKIEVMS